MVQGNTRRDPRDPVEITKLGFEATRQLITLNAGSIVVIGTFLSDIFPSKNGKLEVGAGMKLLIALAFLGFGVSLIVSTLAMFDLQNALYREDPSYTRRGMFLYRALPFFLFAGGLICFGWAVLLNLFFGS
jgi:hypothetical protein